MVHPVRWKDSMPRPVRAQEGPFLVHRANFKNCKSASGTNMTGAGGMACLMCATGENGADVRASVHVCVKTAMTEWVFQGE